MSRCECRGMIFPLLCKDRVFGSDQFRTFFRICIQLNSLWALLSLLLSHSGRKSYIFSKVDMAEAANQKGSVFLQGGGICEVSDSAVVIFLGLNASL